MLKPIVNHRSNFVSVILSQKICVVLFCTDYEYGWYVFYSKICNKNKSRGVYFTMISNSLLNNKLSTFGMSVSLFEAVPSRISFLPVSQQWWSKFQKETMQSCKHWKQLQSLLLLSRHHILKLLQQMQEFQVILLQPGQYIIR